MSRGRKLIGNILKHRKTVSKDLFEGDLIQLIFEVVTKCIDGSSHLDVVHLHFSKFVDNVPYGP